jgi:hypothetical protein
MLPPKPKRHQSQLVFAFIARESKITKRLSGGEDDHGGRFSLSSFLFSNILFSESTWTCFHLFPLSGLLRLLSCRSLFPSLV